MGGQRQTVQTKTGDSGIAAYAKIFDYMLEGCQVISHDFRYLYVNDAVAKQGHSSKQELVGRTMMDCYPGIDKTPMFAKLRECIEQKAVQIMDNEFRFPDGSVGWFELRMEPIPEGAVILSLDITERKLAEERAQNLEELKRSFVQIVSGQLNDSLGDIRHNLEQLRGTISEALGIEERVRLLTAHGAAIEVSDQLAEVSKATSSNQKPGIHKKDAVFGEIWESVLSECRRRTQAKQLHLAYTEPQGGPINVYCDPEKIKLVLVGLVDNALRYTKDGKITITIEQTLGHMRFQITDTGVGLTASDQEKIFKRQFRGANAARLNPNGTGLSLVVDRYYIHQHGGSMGCTSAEDKGSTFWFELPTTA